MVDSYLTFKGQKRYEVSAGAKRSSLLRQSVNYDAKKFCNFGVREGSRVEPLPKLNLKIFRIGPLNIGFRKINEWAMI